MIEALRNAFKLPDLRRRMLYTLLILVIWRLASNIPVPGVDRQALEQFLAGGSATGRLINLIDMLSGGAIANFSVLAAGVSPYVTASIVLQLLVPIFPSLEKKLKEEGEAGQRKMNQWTFFLTVPLALLYSFGLAQALSAQANILPNFGFSGGNVLSTITILLTMTAGTMFGVWLGEMITEQGVGNGLSLIIFGGIVARVPTNIVRLWQTDKVLGIVLFLLLTILTIFVIVFVQEGERRIKVQYGKRVRGMKVYGGGSTYIPLKVNTAGMIPLIFAQSFLTFPAIIAQFFTNPSQPNFANQIVNFFSGTSPWYAPLYFVAVVGFTYFYTDVMVQQQNLPDMLQRQGGFIPGVRPGKKTEEYINHIYRRITLVGALFLGIVAVLPYIIELFRFLNSNVMLITSSGLLIVVGTVIDTMRQLEAQLLMRHYEGFLR
ncbi:MAG: preprotein translocase subunit SecY [Chloroflexi bacterium]|nr:preprotein translocase subunit SecY [Chloroflexota bacterium]HOC21021.1 preprotein translocase subunit SecY [Anaerolineae bacterium]HOS78685.1 preprotein translocase subunit SecY [Anaerolineae bacterium]HQE98143.1 preprotein translocase subunit SecY [Anaerolineae bacterium]HQJ10272.1 preprotein translocase subunit SecY [Anaerolineae bacterium]